MVPIGLLDIIASRIHLYYNTCINEFLIETERCAQWRTRN